MKTTPKDNLRKERWLGFAEGTGDEMSFNIMTEKASGEGRNTPIVRSVIKTRRKNIT